MSIGFLDWHSGTFTVMVHLLCSARQGNNQPGSVLDFREYYPEKRDYKAGILVFTDVTVFVVVLIVDNNPPLPPMLPLSGKISNIH